MHIYKHIPAFRAALATYRKNGARSALVPTMGNLHAGHLALMHKARQHADTVAATIFVNRLQFRPNEDFNAYPRTFAEDCHALERAGVTHLFAPDEAEIYPQAQTYRVTPPPLQADILEGEFRPNFFHGVATIVMKLFAIAQPDIAVFGKKDYQQLMIIRNMVREFNLPIEIIEGEIIRSEDGLALSSRNSYLSKEERQRAPFLYQNLLDIAQHLRRGVRDYGILENTATANLTAQGWNVDYVAIRQKIDLQSPVAHDSGLVVLAAARLGNTRLIDNLEV